MAVVWLNLLASAFFVRVDLTEEQRFTIKDATKNMLADLDDQVYVEVFLEGELNSSFKRFQRYIRETLEEFRIYSDGKVNFLFYDPATALTDKARGEFMQGLMAKGIQPTNIIDTRDGNRVEKLIFPGAIVSYGGVEEGVMLLGGAKAGTAEEKINQSIEGVEYALASAIEKLTKIERKKLGVLRGHGELDDREMASLLAELDQAYLLKEVTLDRQVGDIDGLLIAKPTQAFSEEEKYRLDQYIMRGGKVLMMLDRIQANMDSASAETNFSFPYDLNLDDQLFRYGVRINPDLIQDNTAARYPVNVGNMGDQPQIKLIKWWFYPLFNRFASHPVTRNMDAVLGRFVSTIDTVKAIGVKKTPLIFTSDYSRSLTAPVNVSLQDLRKNLTPEMLDMPNLPVAYLLEGTFTSLFKNRFKPEQADDSDFIDTSAPSAKLLVVSDGDFARNDINPSTGNPQPLGYDPFAQVSYANQDFILNALNYLMDEGGLITARNKEIKIRPLDKVKVKEERLYWQIINLVLPVVLLVLYGLLRWYWRKRKYSRF